MIFTKKSWYRGARQHRWKLLAPVLMISGLCILYYWTNTPSSFVSSLCDPIDVVYTWVNGSDLAFTHSLHQFVDSYDKSRFDDKNELKYSLRSLEMYAPWIRHVYIVTNGQIPKWLDLTNERVTVVPHDALASNLEYLPTFSSAAIETFLHRIPNLSRRFLYLNDDIFLGSELFPEDLYTDSEGVRIYQAWLVPDCAADCPWTYIGDGACDRHCNIPQCQYDGNDCLKDSSEKSEIERVTLKAAAATYHVEQNKAATKYVVKDFPKRNPLATATKSRKFSFKDILLVNHKNLTGNSNVKTVVDSYNKRLQQHFQTKRRLFIDEKHDESKQIKSSKDVYLQSLIYTNMLLNRRYGFKARHVVSHVGFLLDQRIIKAMHNEFAPEILNTASHRFRSPNDLQFSFAYYSFLMEESRSVTVAEIFDEFDTDHSHTWSDREIRTFLAKTFPLPLDWSAVRFFEDVIRNCCLTRCPDIADNKQYTTILYERYEDSNLPTISRDFVQKCVPLAEALEANFALRYTYKYHINPKRNIHNNFFMLTSNVTDVVNALDTIRRTPRKFNCINDNLDTQLSSENDLIRHLLEDFYLSLFPHRSKFELQPQYRNRFENWRDYLKWRRQQKAVLIVIYGSCIISIAYILRSVCKYKAKLVRRCINSL